MEKQPLSAEEMSLIILKRREACRDDYSKWMATIPSQMGWSIAEGNRKFANMKERQLKKLAKKHLLTLKTVQEMFPDA